MQQSSNQNENKGKIRMFEIENSPKLPPLTLETTTNASVNTLKELLSTRAGKNTDVSNEKNTKKFRFSRNNFLSLNDHNKELKEMTVLNRIDAAISQFTSRSNNNIKTSMNIIDRLENKGFKLNPLIYLSNNEQNLLAEVTKQYELMVKENNQSRS